MWDVIFRMWLDTMPNKDQACGKYYVHIIVITPDLYDWKSFSKKVQLVISVLEYLLCLFPSFHLSSLIQHHMSKHWHGLSQFLFVKEMVDICVKYANHIETKKYIFVRQNETWKQCPCMPSFLPETFLRSWLK